MGRRSTLKQQVFETIPESTEAMVTSEDDTEEDSDSSDTVKAMQYIAGITEEPQTTHIIQPSSLGGVDSSSGLSISETRSYEGSKELASYAIRPYHTPPAGATRRTSNKTKRKHKPRPKSTSSSSSSLSP